MFRNFRKPLTLYKCMKKWYISQAFSIFSTRYKKWCIHIMYNPFMHINVSYSYIYFILYLFISKHDYKMVSVFFIFPLFLVPNLVLLCKI